MFNSFQLNIGAYEGLLQLYCCCAVATAVACCCHTQLLLDTVTAVVTVAVLLLDVVFESKTDLLIITALYRNIIVTS